MTENQQPYEIKVGQHGKNCECSKCQPHRDCHNCGRPISGDACTMSATDINTCLQNKSRPFWQAKKTDREKLERYLEQGKQNTALNDIGHTHACNCSECGELTKSFNMHQEGMPCDFCSHHVNSEPSYCVTCDPENSNYDGHEFEVEAEDNVKYDPKSRYYDAGGLEVLDIIRAKLTPEQYQGFCLGNAIKYTCRANHKGDYDRDLEKACFYAKEAR